MATNIKLRTEEDEQEAVLWWANMVDGRHKELRLLYHCPNGGTRDMREAAKLKRMGVIPGVPDLHLPVARAGYIGLYIEMKYGDNRITREQKEFMKAAAAEENYCVACYTAEDAINVIIDYLNNMRAYDNLAIIKNGVQSGSIR
jgi:hypothetical protein